MERLSSLQVLYSHLLTFTTVHTQLHSFTLFRLLKMVKIHPTDGLDALDGTDGTVLLYFNV